MSEAARLARTSLLLSLVVSASTAQESADDHVKRGVAQTAGGEFDEAIASFREAIELQPDSAAAHYHLGEAQLQKGEVDEAITSFRKTIELQPNFATAYFGLGLGHEAKGERDEAIVSYREAIEHDSTFALAYVQLGMSLAATQQFGEGIEYLGKAIELLPNDAASEALKTQLQTARESLGRARISSNEADAIRDIRSIIQAEHSYARTNGGFFDNLDCLGAPSSCISALPPDAPAFLGAETATVSTRSGYERTFHPGPAANIDPHPRSSVSPTSISSFAYVAVPEEAQVTGRRGFCGDATGRICYTEDGSRPEPQDGHCPPSCIDLGIPPQD